MNNSGLVILSLNLYFLVAGFGFGDEVAAKLQSFIIATFDNPNAPPACYPPAIPFCKHRGLVIKTPLKGARYVF
jgi:hypothetical protein